MILELIVTRNPILSFFFTVIFLHKMLSYMLMKTNYTYI